ncbi:hypothetical protein MPTK1_5g11310 [Marchantia polymorpha subsp. ruderalis]|uniref:Uncharacterized protein n=1 Tax=Marchantia polymorpha TaxID=3197 RepID=A0A2R6WGK2_MARPO|nr:hypothetical protein MARPO_0093s0054 [Marchantia polymorpha]|eukprot:PTQ32980.1 hypothetical protein MARPO_0093s0054 [Marchantia polymorpha]
MLLLNRISICSSGWRDHRYSSSHRFRCSTCANLSLTPDDSPVTGMSLRAWKMVEDIIPGTFRGKDPKIKILFSFSRALMWIILPKHSYTTEYFYALNVKSKTRVNLKNEPDQLNLVMNKIWSERFTLFGNHELKVHLTRSLAVCLYVTSRDVSQPASIIQQRIDAQRLSTDRRFPRDVIKCVSKACVYSIFAACTCTMIVQHQYPYEVMAFRLVKEYDMNLGTYACEVRSQLSCLRVRNGHESPKKFLWSWRNSEHNDRLGNPELHARFACLLQHSRGHSTNHRVNIRAKAVLSPLNKSEEPSSQTTFNAKAARIVFFVFHELVAFTMNDVNVTVITPHILLNSSAGAALYTTSVTMGLHQSGRTSDLIGNFSFNPLSTPHTIDIVSNDTIVKASLNGGPGALKELQTPRLSSRCTTAAASGEDNQTLRRKSTTCRSHPPVYMVPWPLSVETRQRSDCSCAIVGAIALQKARCHPLAPDPPIKAEICVSVLQASLTLRLSVSEFIRPSITECSLLALRTSSPAVMRTKYTIAVAVAVILSIATLVAATSYQSKCYNDSEHDVEVRIKLILGLDVLGLITVVKHTVVDILYTLSGLIAGLLGLTWNLSCKINNIIYSCDVYVPVGGTVRCYDELNKVAVSVNGIFQTYMT